MTPTDKKNIRVLVAEDDFLIGHEISRILAQMGYERTGIAPNGEKAVEMVLEHRPDVVLMDIKMPRMDGLQASVEIQQKCPTPIVILTAQESSDFVAEASLAGVGAYLTKPPKAEELERAITIAIARHSDLMESYQLIRQLEEKREELHRELATKNRFLSILAHDLRNPVSAMMAFSKQLYDDVENIDRNLLKQYLHTFHQTSKNLYSLLDNLLIWARVQTGRIKLLPVQLNLNDLINTVVNLYNPQIVEKSIKVDIAIPADTLIVSDEQSLLTIFRNLLSNAIKFTPHNGLVIVEAELSGDRLSISISDSGIGIAPEDQEKLFRIDAVYTNPGTDGEEGNGLGLIICRELIRTLGGDIHFVSTLHQGTRFTITLPLTYGS